MSTPNPLETAKTDVTKAAAAVSAADGTLATWIKNNSGKVAIAILAAAALVVWKLIF